MRNTGANTVQHTKKGRIVDTRATISCLEMFNDYRRCVRILTLVMHRLSSWFDAHKVQAQEAIPDAGDEVVGDVTNRLCPE